MTIQVIVAEPAQRDIAAISEWWTLNRRAAPDRFERELEEAVELLSDAPEIGTRFRRARRAGTRRLLLWRSGFHVYYIYRRGPGTVTVLAVRGAVRGRGPQL